MVEQFIKMIKAVRNQENPEETLELINEILKKGGEHNT